MERIPFTNPLDSAAEVVACFEAQYPQLKLDEQTRDSARWIVGKYLGLQAAKPELKSVSLNFRSAVENLGIGLEQCGVSAMDEADNFLGLESEYEAPSLGFVHPLEGPIASIAAEIPHGKRRVIQAVNKGLHIGTWWNFGSEPMDATAAMKPRESKSAPESTDLVFWAPVLDEEKLKASDMRWIPVENPSREAAALFFAQFMNETVHTRAWRQLPKF